MVCTLYNLYSGLQFISDNGEATITPENLKLRFLIILIDCMYGICVLAFTRLGKNMLVTILSKSVDYSLLAVVDPHLQVSRGQSSRP